MLYRLSHRTKTKNLPTSPSSSIKSKTRPRIMERKLDIAERAINKQLANVSSSELATVPDRTLALKNNRGAHMKGESEKMKRLRGMRRIYGKQMPKPQCNTCAFSTNCPQFKADYECSFLPFLNSHKVETVEDMVEYMKELCGANMQRLHLASIFERLSGGSPTSELSESYAMAFQQLAQLAEMERGTKPITSGGSRSIIQNLFGSINLLVTTTDGHAREISEAVLDIPQDNGESPAAQLALTTSQKQGSVNEELIAELTNSQQYGPDEAPPVRKQQQPKTIPTISVSSL